MRIGELEVGQQMVELQAIQLHDIRAAALVFRMTGAALAGARILHASVISPVLLHVGGNIFVAVQA